MEDETRYLSLWQAMRLLQDEAIKRQAGAVHESNTPAIYRDHESSFWLDRSLIWLLDAGTPACVRDRDIEAGAISTAEHWYPSKDDAEATDWVFLYINRLPAEEDHKADGLEASHNRVLDRIRQIEARIKSQERDTGELLHFIRCVETRLTNQRTDIDRIEAKVKAALR